MRFKNIALKLGSLAIIIHFASRCSRETFGKVTVDQFLWNISYSLTGVDMNLIKPIIENTCYAILSCLLWYVVVYFNRGWVVVIKLIVREYKKKFFPIFQNLWRNFVRWFLKKAPIILCCIALVALLGVTLKLNKDFRITNYVSENYFTAESTDFIQQHYKVPLFTTEHISFPQKNNLVIVLAESLEKTFTLPQINPTPLMPNLVRQLANSQTIERFVQANGTT